jgi:hypothetical protein
MNRLSTRSRTDVHGICCGRLRSSEYGRSIFPMALLHRSINPSVACPDVSSFVRY